LYAADPDTKAHADTAEMRRDPLANSYVSSVAEDPAADPRLAVEDVPRTAEEDEEFGIAYLRAHGEEGVTHAAAGELTECRLRAYQ
jgi:zinc finger protein